MIKRDTQHETELIKGSGGVFEVKIDGDLIYSKKATGCFPDEQRLLADIKAKLES